MKQVGVFVLCVLTMYMPFAISVGFDAVFCGTATHVTSLWVFGPNTPFTCEWKNGSKALFRSETGNVRLVDVSSERTGVEIGKRYRLGRLHVKFAQRVFLIPA